MFYNGTEEQPDEQILLLSEGILKDILEVSKAEVLEMVLFEYNEEPHIESKKKIAKEEICVITRT